MRDPQCYLAWPHPFWVQLQPPQSTSQYTASTIYKSRGFSKKYKKKIKNNIGQFTSTTSFKMFKLQNHSKASSQWIVTRSIYLKDCSIPTCLFSDKLQVVPSWVVAKYKQNRFPHNYNLIQIFVWPVVTSMMNDVNYSESFSPTRKLIGKLDRIVLPVKSGKIWPIFSSDFIPNKHFSTRRLSMIINIAILEVNAISKSRLWSNPDRKPWVGQPGVCLCHGSRISRFLSWSSWSWRLSLPGQPQPQVCLCYSWAGYYRHND